MKKIYIKSVFDLEKESKINDVKDWDLITDLILYDLDFNYVYYIFNTSEILENSRRSLKYLLSKNNYMTLALQDAYDISEENFNELLNTPSRDFYSMYKKDFLISIGLQEWII
jgi:predicted DNA-binding helix-hairpin-helix protein